MKVSLAGIYDRGSHEKERVHFRADYDLNLSFFVLLDTVRINTTEVSAGNLKAYWFPPRQIPRGQHIVVYTRAGNTNVETRKDGAIYHFLFRGLPNSLYSLPEASAVLMEVQTWVSALANTSSLPPLPPQPSGLAAAGTPTYGSSLMDHGISSGLGIAGGPDDYTRRLVDILKTKKDT
jgi:hypothetical protein